MLINAQVTALIAVGAIVDLSDKDTLTAIVSAVAAILLVRTKLV